MVGRRLGLGQGADFGACAAEQGCKGGETGANEGADDFGADPVGGIDVGP